MLNAPIPIDEQHRLSALHRYCVLDTPAEPAFDRLTQVAAHLLGVPTVLVSLVDADRQWFKSRVGLAAEQTPRNISFCGHAVYLHDKLVVPDATQDPRFSDNPLVTGPLGLRFYAGVPLITDDGFALGTLCCIDYVPRPHPSAEQMDLLAKLADAVVAALELRQHGLALEQRTRMAQAMGQMAAQANAGSALGPALPAMLETLCNYAGACVGHVQLYNADSNSLASSGIWWTDDGTPAPAWADKPCTVDMNVADDLLSPPTAGGPPQLVLAGEAGSEGRAGRARSLGMNSALAFGFQACGQVQGVVECFGTRFAAPPDDLLAVAEYAAAQIGRLAERQRLDQLKDDFVNTVSHELRTPLTSISGSLELLTSGRYGALPDKAGSLANMALRNSLRLTRLVNDILDLGKIEAGCTDITLLPTELVPLIERAIDETQAYAGAFKVALQAVGCEGTARALVDADRTIQILTNLLSNAAKFSPAGTSVEVRLQRADAHWRISVADRGPGIPPEFQTRVFKKFAQAATAGPRQAIGTGLGLAIVKRLAEAMQGSVGFTTQQGLGTVFHVELPAVD